MYIEVCLQSKQAKNFAGEKRIAQNFEPLKFRCHSFVSGASALVNILQDAGMNQYTIYNIQIYNRVYNILE